MQIYCNATAWWNEALHIKFLDFMFKRESPCEPVLLMVDDFSGHWTAKVQAHAASIGVHLLKVPKSCTSVCQPADISWNMPFKTHLRGMWVDLLKSQVMQHNGSAKFKLKPPTRNLMSTWVKTAWQALTPETIASGFKKANIVLQDPDPVEDGLVDLLEKCQLVDRTVSDSDDMDANTSEDE
jgi:hypothetical protein